MMKSKNRLLLTILLCIGSIFAFGQERKTVTGVVKDSSGNTLAGVTIKVKGGKNAGATDGQGYFIITIPSDNSVLEFTSVGYIAKDLAVRKGQNVTVSLAGSASSLNEVVVTTGFGEGRKKRGLGYSMTQVSGDDIRKSNPVNPISALQGLVPGLQVQSGVGGPQATPRFLIRGSASLDPYGNQPLIVVDDIIMDQNVVLPNRGGDQDFGNILKDINPDDIESISVLKGGAVTALYGTRASNGVILIKTKKGFSQKGLGVSFSESVQWSKAYKTVDFQNVYGSGLGLTDFVTGPNNQLQVNPATYGYNFGPAMTGQTVLDVTGKVIQNNPQPNNILDVFHTGYTRNTNVGLSGGNEKGTFRLSFSNLGSAGITPNNDFKRNSISFRGTQRLANVLLVDANVSYTQSNAFNPANVGTTGVLRQFSYGGTRNYDTQYWLTHYKDSLKGGLNRNDPSGMTTTWFDIYEKVANQLESNFRGSVDVKATLTKGLEFQGNTSVNYIGRNNESKNRGRDSGFFNPSYSSSINNVRVQRYRANLNYNQKIGDQLSMLLQGGGEINTSEGKGANYSTNGTILPDIYRLSNSRNAVNINEDKPNKTQTNSLFFQGSLAFHDYLTVNLYGRNDWNSTLIYNDQHGKFSYFYPGADLAFVFTDAFKAIPSFFDFGKLRLSYAQVGGGTGAYTANTGAYQANTPYVSNNGTVVNYQYASNTLPNQALVPTRQNKIEGGLELKMFHNRLGADITYYSQDSKNQIINFGVPNTSGVGAALINGGTVRNKGWEINLNGTPIKTRDFSWDTYFNYTRNRNLVISLPFGLEYVSLGGGDGFEVIAKRGGEYGAVTARYGYAHYQATDNNANDGKPVDNPANGRRVIRTTSATGSAVYVRAQNYVPGLVKQPVIGSITPDFLGNWRNNFNYKSFQLGIALDSKFGGMIYSETHDLGSWLGSMESTLPYRTKETGGIEYVNAAGVTLPSGVILDGVYQQGTVITGLDGASHNLSGMSMQEAYDKGWVKPTNASSMYQNTHSWGNGIREESMFVSSWVSVQQVSLTYDVPVKIASKVKMNGLRVSILGNNLFYLYNSAKDHVNPDNLRDSGSGAISETSGMPYFRNFGFSVNGSF